jgi:hypothetical protein
MRIERGWIYVDGTRQVDDTIALGWEIREA